MTATMNPTFTHAELEKEYRIALRFWSEARYLYPVDSREVVRATDQLTMLESQLLKPDTTTNQTVVPALDTH